MAKSYKIPKPKDLLSAGVHFGHQSRRWNPKMEAYIFDQRKGIHIIDLEQTEKLLKAACDFLYDTAKSGGQVIFVGTKRQAAEIITIEAKRCGALFVTERWLGGTLTNYKVVSQNIDGLVDFLRKRENDEFGHYTKKERLMIDRKIERLEKFVGGLIGLKSRPGALFVVDARREKTAVREALRMGVPVIALIDTNSDPTGIEYIVPGNDDAIKSIAIVVKALADAVFAGYKDMGKEADKKVKEEVEAAARAAQASEEVPAELENVVQEVEVKTELKEIEVEGELKSKRGQVTEKAEVIVTE